MEDSKEIHKETSEHKVLTCQPLFAEIADANVRGFIKKWLIENRVELVVKDGYRKKGTSDSVPQLTVVQQLYENYHSRYIQLSKAAKTAKLNTPIKLDKERFKECLDVMEHETREAALANVRQQLAHRPGLGGLEELKRFAHNLTGSDDELIVAALFHFIWQTKRKLFNKEVEWHMMVVIVSLLGGKAKTVNAKRIALIKDKAVGKESNLLKPFTCKLNGKAMTDERCFGHFMDNYICFNDEFSKMEKANYEEAKRLITEDSIQYRPMRTNKEQSGPQNSTFFGTGNMYLNEHLFDTSGTRRFFQVIASLGHTDEEEQRKIAENIDYLMIWQSVDEKLSYNESWQSKFKARFDAAAEAGRHRDEIEQFMTQYNIKPGSLPVSVTDMYETFKNFLTEENSNWSPKRTQFKTKMENRGITHAKTRTGWVWMVDPAWGPEDNSLEDDVTHSLRIKLKQAEADGNYELCAQIQEKLQDKDKFNPLFE